MFGSKKIALTLLLHTALVMIPASEAHIQHRDHTNLKRLIKKRAITTPSILQPVIGAGAAPPTGTPTSVASSASAAQSSKVSTSDSASISASPTPSSASLSLNLSDILNSLGSGSSTISASSTSSAASSSTSSTITTEALDLTAAPTPSTPSVQQTVTRTQAVDASTTPSKPPLTSGAVKTKSTTLTVLIVVGASVAAVAILWTVFRKWKLGRSSKFDERLNPINWQPTSADDGALPGSHRRHSGSSFQSGSGHPNAAGAAYNGSDHGHGYTGSSNTYGLPEHDFTAGPSHLAPVGGYADLARGSSPQPQMNQTGHSVSISQSHYDVGVPLHHQAGY